MPNSDPASSQPSTSALVARSPAAVAAVALLGYLLIFAAFFNHFGDLRDFVVIGKPFIMQSTHSPVIQADPNYNYDKFGVGYDGQFAYYIALDPANARYYVDQGRVAYRYTRILYPILARSFALGNPAWIAPSLIAVNLLAAVVGTWAVAAWCARRGLSPWLALIYTFYIGQVIAFVRDLNEVVAYALVALGIYLLSIGRRGIWWGAGAFALAGLTRETTLIFPALYAAFLLLNRPPRWLDAAILGAISVAPTIIWEGFLLWWLGSLGWLQGTGLFVVPFGNLYSMYPLRTDTLEVIQAIVLPGAICLVIGLSILWRNAEARRGVVVWALALHALLFVVLLHPDSLFDLYGSARVTIPIVMCAIYSLAYTPTRSWFFACSALWLASTVSFAINPLLELLHPR